MRWIRRHSHITSIEKRWNAISILNPSIHERDFINIIHILISYSRPQPSHHPSKHLLLLPTQLLLNFPANTAPLREILPNRTTRRERPTNLLSGTADRAVFGESTADGALLVENRGALRGVGGFLAGLGGED